MPWTKSVVCKWLCINTGGDDDKDSFEQKKKERGVQQIIGEVNLVNLCMDS